MYPANAINWKVGDLVIHKCDSKRVESLMEIVEIRDCGTAYGTKYLFTEFGKYYKRDQVLEFTKEELLNPEDFGIKSKELMEILS